MPIRGPLAPLRHLLLLAVLAALAVCSSASAAPVFYVWGKGWGHGIGMPQYGAYGYALHGKSYTWILDHFYTGTRPGTAAKKRIRVLLDAGRSSVDLRSPTTWTVEDGRGRSWELRAGTRTVTSGLKVRINRRMRRLAAPVTFTRSRGLPLVVNGTPYRGSIVLRKQSSRLAIVNVLGLQPYLRGVVAWEMPADWHREALKAQAVAARSYGLANVTTGTFFDVYDDTRDQVYGGVSAEHPRTNAAVKATANEVRTYRGRLATTFFYSSSGGRTAANEDVWGSSPVPYLRSVVDPYDRISPNHTWGPTRYSRAALDGALGGYVAGTLRDAVVRVNPSRRAGSVRLSGTQGATSVRGDTLRSVLGLRSTWFRIGLLKLVPHESIVVYGDRARLTGRARSVGKAWLETRRAGGEWQKLRGLELTSASRFSTSVKPHVRREYRVRSTKGASNPRLVRVAAKVLFSKPVDREELAGIVRPRRSGVKVTVQRLQNGRWNAVKSGRTKAAGDFSIAFEVKNGSYRALARVPGLARGVSPLLEVIG
jgi:stage II sporulation protein D